MKRSHIQHELFDLNVLPKMNIFQLWKILVVDKCEFMNSSTLVPDELEIIAGSVDYNEMSPVNYAEFLTRICHDHIENTHQVFDYFVIRHEKDSKLSVPDDIMTSVLT